MTIFCWLREFTILSEGFENFRGNILARGRLAYELVYANDANSVSSNKRQVKLKIRNEAVARQDQNDYVKYEIKLTYSGGFHVIMLQCRVPSRYILGLSLSHKVLAPIKGRFTK